MSEEQQDQKPQQRRELVPVTMSGGMMQPQNLHEALEFARLIAYSGMVPKGFEENPGAVLVAIQMGAEVGLSPMASIQNIAVVNGRPSLWGDAMLAVVLAHPECEDVEETLDESTTTAKCTVKRRGRAPVVRTFSQADAKTAGLWGKGGPWTNYPKRMLQMRARAFALRDSFPDALRGISMAEEVQDIPQAPEWVGADGAPREGVHSFNGGKPQPHQLPAAGPAPVVEHVAAAPQPVEAKPEPAPQQQAAKAEPKPAAKAKPETKQEPSGQTAVKW
jgi:hypothetical protein